MIKTCFIRVDANSNIGTGHLVRTEILDDELATRNYNIIFLCLNIPKKYSDKLDQKNGRRLCYFDASTT